eukprot:Awhi_evm1s10733
MSGGVPKAGSASASLSTSSSYAASQMANQYSVFYIEQYPVTEATGTLANIQKDDTYLQLNLWSIFGISFVLSIEFRLL